MAVSGFVEKAKDKVSFAKKIPMLLEATSDDPEPTPGYVFHEITKLTFESISSCNALLDFLLKRLKKSSPHVKFKVISVLKQTSINGQSEFRSGLRRQADGLRDAASFTGPLDPLNGDAFNQKVRSSATQLIELLFNVERPELTDSVVASISLGRKMEGFGNSPVQKPTRESLFDSMVNQVTHRLPDVSSFLKPKGTLKDNLTVNQPPYSQNHLTANKAYNSKPHQFAENTSSIQNFVESHPLDGLTLTENSCAESELTSELDEQAEMSPEKRLVDEITAEGGIRAVPSRDVLQHFAARCSVLNVAEVLKLLNFKLEDASKEVQMKSLHVIEHLLKSDIPNIAQEVLCYCINLQTTQHFESAALKAKTKKILKIAESGKSASNGNCQTSRSDDKLTNVSNCDLLKLDPPKTTSLDELYSKDVKQVSGTTAGAIFSGLSVQPFIDPEPVDRTQQNAQPSEPFSLFTGLGLADSNQPSENLPEAGTVYLNTSRTAESATGRTSIDLFDPLSDFTSNDKTSTNLETNSAGILNFTATGRTNTEPAAKETLLLPNNASQIGMNLLSSHGPGENTISAPDSNRRASQNASVTQEHVIGGNNWSAVIPTQTPIRFQVPNEVNVTPVINALSVDQGCLSGQSSIPLRLPKPVEKRAFDFVGKSNKGDAFDFVQDEIKAQKR